MKYAGAAMAVGGAAMLGTAAISSGSSIKKKAKKTATKAIDAMDSVLKTMQNVIK